MKLKDEYKRLPKDIVYDTYLSIVYNIKDYDDITRPKMLDAIIKEYGQKNFLYSICTSRELEFLKYISNNKFKIEDLKRYEWEIKELNKKCIFSMVTFEVFEEQKENVKKALETYKEGLKESEDKIITFMISTIRKNAEMLTKPFIGMLVSMFNMDEELAKELLGHPLFNFYCEFGTRWMESLNKNEEIIIYRQYYDILEELQMKRLEYGIAGNIPFDIRDDYDIFYYGFPIRNVKVKKMYDMVGKRLNKDFLFNVIDEARVLNDRDMLSLLIDDEKLIKVINEALDEMPCAAMNGFTPNDAKKECEKSELLEDKFDIIPQHNAHLSKNGADLFYKLYFGLLDYINKKEKINPKLKRIYKQEGLDVSELSLVDEYLWNNKNEIDEFIKENPYKFSLEELEIIKGFKTAVSSDNFIIVGFDREYTKILSEDGKLYMVKGVRCDMDKLLDSKSIPIYIKTTLLMFKDKIIFKSFFSSYPISMGNGFKEQVLNDLEKAIKCYHL